MYNIGNKDEFVQDADLVTGKEPKKILKTWVDGDWT